MQLFVNDQGISLTLRGEITAITPISVTRPDDNFKSLTADDKKPRLPRMGAKRDDVSPFIPGSSFRSGLRHSAVQVIAKMLNKKFTVDQIYMLVQGVDTTRLTASENVDGEIDKESDLRSINPFLSLFGRWGLPSHVGVGDLIPVDKNCIFTAGAGVRTNEFIRNPTAVNLIDDEQLGYLKELLQNETSSAGEVREIDGTIRKLLKQLRDAESKLEKENINAEITILEERKKDVKANKVGSENTIQRPLSGFEAVIPNTVMNQRIVLQNVNKAELGLFLASVAEFSRSPIIGGHRNYACGAVSGEYAVNYWAFGEDRPKTVATIRFDEEGFVIEGDAAEELYAIRKQFLEDVKQLKFDFTQYLINLPEA